MTTCYHCSEECEIIIDFDDKQFCCDGCQTVYDILSTNSLDRYYQIEKNAGTKANKNYTGKFDFLDLEEFKSRFILFSENGISKVVFFLPQIHCSSCLWLLERLPKLHGGVIQSQINFTAREAEITFNESQISLKKVAELLASIGYPPTFSEEKKNKKGEAATNKKLILQIGVAGFCFGNTMLLSFPEYLGINEHDANFQKVFNGLNLLLSIPVLLFSARDYITSAYHAVKSKFINIDVPITLGILAFYFQSMYEIISGTGAGYFDSFAGLIFFLLIGKWFQQTTYGSINFERDYKSYFPIAVSKKVGGEEKIMPLSEIKIGDFLVIRNNEIIPADAVLTNGKGIVNYSFVTGESALVSKQVGEKLFAGGRQEGPAIEIEIQKSVENSYLTKLWNNPIFDKEKLNTSFTEKVTKYFTLIILLTAFIAAIIWSLIDPSKSLFIVISVLIIACPCAIALSVPFTYGNGVRILGRKSFYLRSSKVIESISTITDIVFDKTGTITQNGRSEINWNGSEMSIEHISIISEMTNHSSHPLSRQINRFLNSKSHTINLTDLNELSGSGLSAKQRNVSYKLGSAVWLGINDDKVGTQVYFSVDDTILGSFSFTNVYREGIENLFNQLKSNFRIHILSGDNEGEKSSLEKIVPTGTPLLFNQQPEDKLNYIAQLQKSGARVMMLGDGLNDAGALKQSDFGVSVVEDVYSFSPSSDGIIDGNKLSNLKRYIDFCSFNKQVVKLSYAFSIFYNVIGLSFALTGTLTPLVAAVLMPVSSISVVILVTLLTNLRGKKLG